jgi:molybdopterin converting factor small subunit
MMKIEVNLVAAYKLIAQKGRLSIEMPENSSVFDVIKAVVKTTPTLKSHWLEKDGSPSQHLHPFLNGDDLSTLSDGLNTCLVDGDSLDFIPPLSGG